MPAPAGVPVERLVGKGLVGPLTLRPASGVWARSRSRPRPPGRPVAAFVPDRLAADVLRAAGRLPDGLALAAPVVLRPEAFRALLAVFRPLVFRPLVFRALVFPERAFRAPVFRLVFRLDVRRLAAGRLGAAFLRAAVFVLRPPVFRAAPARPVPVLRFTELFRAAPAVLRDAAFLAMVTDPRVVIRDVGRGGKPPSRQV